MTHLEAIDIAAEYMEQKGWYVRHRRWEYDHRNLDMVCIDEDMSTLVFIEILNNGCKVSPSQDDMVVTAAMYVRDYHLENIPIRFDRISVYSTPEGSYNIKHTENTCHIADPYIFYEQMRDRQRVHDILCG